MSRSAGKPSRGRPPSVDNLPEIMTVPLVARFLRMSEGDAYRAVHVGQIPALKVGSRFRILKRALLAALGDPLATTQVGDGDGSGSDIASLGPQSHDQISRSTTG